MGDLYFWPTGNGKKIIILLEELGFLYTIKPINIGRGDQLTPELLKISPNGRMPAFVDDEPMGGGEPLSIFESGAIMTYLAEKTGRFCPADPRGRYDVAEWVSWQLANQGPKLGEQGHFRRALAGGANGDPTYALRRFDNEAHRIYGVINLGLFNKRYLAAGEYTIADMICYPWASSWATRGIEIDEFPKVKRWLEEMGERPAVKKAMAMGPEFREDPASISPEEQDYRDTAHALLDRVGLHGFAHNKPRIVRRHAPARGDLPGARLRPGIAADGRTVQRARRDHVRRDERVVTRSVAAIHQDRAVRDAQHPRGRVSRRPSARDDPAPGDDCRGSENPVCPATTMALRETHEFNEICGHLREQIEASHARERR